MSFEPQFTLLVCPFCGQACDHPPDHRHYTASCGCGATLVVDSEVSDSLSDLLEEADDKGKRVDERIVRKVDFYGPPEPDGEWDGELGDALFYFLR